MRESQEKNINPVQNIVSKLWSMFDLFKSEKVSPDEYYVALFFLSLYKDGFFDFEADSIPANYKQYILSDLHKQEKFKNYSSIFDSFEPTVKLLSNNYISGFISSCSAIDRRTLKKNYSEIFDTVLYQIAKSHGRLSGEFIQPYELTRLFFSLIDLPDNAKIFNPFAGLASFGVYLDKDKFYYGQELNERVWALGALRLMAYEMSGNSKYACENSILNWPDESEKFDLVIANPPFGMRLDNQLRDKYPFSSTIEHFLLEQGIRSLNINGKLIAILSSGFLYRGQSDYRLRKYLLDHDLIESIITLPGGVLLNTTTSSVILVLNNDKKHPGMVKLVNAQKFVDSRNPRETVLDYNGVRNCVSGADFKDDVVSTVSNEQIIANDYSLSVPRYFLKDIDGVKLGDVLEFIKGKGENIPDSGKLVRIRDLKDDRIDFSLDYQTIEEVELGNHNCRIVDESCLLLAGRWKTLKPTYFKFDETQIFLSPDVFSFRVKEALVDINFIIAELHAEYVLQQIDSYRIGVTVPYIRKEDLLNVVIKLPSLEEQRAKVAGLREAIVASKVKEAALEAQKYGLYSQYFKEISDLKHTLGKPLFKINNTLKLLKKTIEESESSGKPVKLSNTVSESSGYTLRDNFESIEENLMHISNILENTGHNLQFENFKLEPLDFVYFFWNYIEELSLNYTDRFDVLIETGITDPDEYGKVFIHANADLLKIALDNIVDNALRHGFTEEGKKNKMIFYFGDTEIEGQTYIEMEILNNGSPFPYNFNQEKLIRKNVKAGRTANTGIGGYQIDQIMKHLNGSFELDTDYAKFWPVMYTLYFPITEIKTNEYEEV